MKQMIEENLKDHNHYLDTIDLNLVKKESEHFYMVVRWGFNHTFSDLIYMMELVIKNPEMEQVEKDELLKKIAACFRKLRECYALAYEEPKSHSKRKWWRIFK